MFSEDVYHYMGRIIKEKYVIILMDEKLIIKSCLNNNYFNNNYLDYQKFNYFNFINYGLGI